MEIYKNTPAVNAKRGKDIPFDVLDPGQSVILHYSEIKEDSLRNIVSIRNKRYPNKQFKVCRHKDGQYYEIACILAPDAQLDLQVKIVESSPEAKATILNGLPSNRSYPFFEVPEGKSFIMPFGATPEKLEKSLRVQCSVQSKKLDCKFIVLKHEKYGMFEVYHVPKKPLSFFEPSAEMQEKVSELK